MSEVKGSEYKALLISGLLAILGTVAGGVIKTYMDNKLAVTNFHARLIEHALQSDNLDNRRKYLQFLADVHLIDDEKMVSALRDAAQHPATIPQYSPSVAPSNTIPSVRTGLLAEHPELVGKTVAVVGLWVRAGDVIDGITPRYAELGTNLSVGDKRYFARRIGGTGGDETALIKTGYTITGIDLYPGTYFNGPAIVQLEVTWSKLTAKGIDQSQQLHSPRLGSGKFAVISEKPKHFQAAPDEYIYDIKAINSQHTSGETFTEDLDVSYRRLPPRS